MSMKYTVTVDGDVFQIEVGPGGRAWVNDRPYEVDLQHLGDSGEYSLLVNNRSYEVHVAEGGNGHRWVTVGGRRYRANLQRGHRSQGNGGTRTGENGDCDASGQAGCMEMRAPLPGLLVELDVREGERVEEQQVVAVLESMKMNLEIRAPRDGVVHDLCATPGRQVAQDEVLAVLGPNGARED
jgi:biotin carboxyl carrier protein